MVIDYGDEDSLMTILNKLNADRDLLEQISKNAGLIYDELRWEKVYEKYQKVYTTLLKS
jgi:glycosyltransferase involved in cell wall biosynthesis